MPSQKDRVTAISNMHKNLVKIGHLVSDMVADKQTYRNEQRDMVITILCSSVGAEH